jgi:hypothetical protein
MNTDKDTQLEVLSHHYSESYELLKAAVEKRDRLLLYMLVVIFILLLYMSAPGTVGDWLNSFVNNQVHPGNNGPINALIDVSFIGVILMLGLLSLSHTYFQTVLHVERQHDYIYQLEARLSQAFDELVFTREGKHYRQHKRLFARWTQVIFWMLLPALFLAFLVYWEIFLFTRSQAPAPYLIVDTLISVSMAISLGLYLFAIFRKK